MKLSKTVAVICTMILLSFVGLVIFEVKVPHRDLFGLLSFVATLASLVWVLIKSPTV